VRKCEASKASQSNLKSIIKTRQPPGERIIRRADSKIS
jgi:hypothetical protein